jgi:phospholipase/carboxylesterase
MQALEFVEVSTSNTPDSSIIWLHGLGADGHDFEGLVSELQLPKTLRVKFLFPHAPVQPVSINGGFPMRAWFDILGLDRNANQDEAGIRRAEQLVNQLIEQTIQTGIPSERIIVGGFSQGGALALHLALRYPQKLAGAIGLSTYVPLAGFVSNEKHQVNSKLPLFLAHGTQDNIVPYQFGKISYELLTKLDYPVTWKEYPIGHTVSAQEIENISQWVQTIIR